MYNLYEIREKMEGIIEPTMLDVLDSIDDYVLQMYTGFIIMLVDDGLLDQEISKIDEVKDKGLLELTINIPVGRILLGINKNIQFSYVTFIDKDNWEFYLTSYSNDLHESLNKSLNVRYEIKKKQESR